MLDSIKGRLLHYLAAIAAAILHLRMLVAVLARLTGPERPAAANTRRAGLVGLSRSFPPFRPFLPPSLYRCLCLCLYLCLSVSPSLTNSFTLTRAHTLTNTRVPYATLEHMQAVGTHYGPTRTIEPSGHAIGGTAQLALRSSSTTATFSGPRH